MKRISTLCLFLSLLFSYTAHAQSNAAKDKSLLWRISGHGLPQASYLYGTMHLQDKRLFNFGDSLYHFIDKVEGFATEVDFQSYLDSSLQKVLDDVEGRWLDRQMKTRTDKKKLLDSLVRNVKEHHDRASRKELQGYRDKKMRNIIKNKEMPTMVDAFLYGIAKRKGKWLGGVEDIRDQLSLLDEMGADISTEELMTPDTLIAISLERMIQLYLDKDLVNIAKYSSSSMSAEMEDMMLAHRNHKMVISMDSLSKIRTMFYAVGAAHLPGEEGVIALLRNQGYKVEPVYSATTIEPLKYFSALRELPWIKVEDSNKNYYVEMPGQASDLGMLNDYIKMKMYADISTMTFYMAGSVVGQKNMDLKKIMKSFSENVESEISNQHVIQRDGLQGIEAQIESDGQYFTLQYLQRDNRIFMLLAGGDSPDKSQGKDAKKFFNSFKAMQAQAIKGAEWTDFSLADKGITLQFPGTPRQNKLIEKKAEGTEWKFSVYDYSNADAGTYYMLQVRDLTPGYFMSGDSVYFDYYRSNMKAVMPNVTTNELRTVQGYPALQYDGSSEDKGIFFKSLNILRGGRVYSVFAGGPNEEANIDLMDKFFSSAKLTDYEIVPWKKESTESGNFYAVAPSPFKVFEKPLVDTTVAMDKPEEPEHYYSADLKRVQFFEVYKQTISPYYWAENDSSFFEQYGGSYKSYEDSILSRKQVKNGSLPAMEWVISMPRNHNIKKVRQILNGDTLYTLLSYFPQNMLGDKQQANFFEGFRAIKENTSTTLFTNKMGAIVQILQTGDSTERAKAKETVRLVSMTKKDLPLLQEALLKQYPDDTDEYSYSTSAQILANFVTNLTDSSTVKFIADHFAGLTVGGNSRKMQLINILASYKTAYSYTALKKILLEYAPLDDGGISLSYRLSDSLELAKILVPEILPLAASKAFGPSIIYMADVVLPKLNPDAGMLQAYKRVFYPIADSLLREGRKKGDSLDVFTTGEVVDVVAALNDAKGNQLLQQFLLLKKKELVIKAVFGLLKNGQPVQPAVLESLAADKVYRRELYDSLEGLSKIKLFPKKYLTQRAMSESDMYTVSYDDEEEENPPKMEYLGERTAQFKNKSSKFYLYKLTYTYEGDDGEVTNEYLGITGAYELNPLSLKANSYGSGYYYQEKFDRSKINEQFKAFLARREELDY